MTATAVQTKIEIPYPESSKVSLVLRLGPCRMHFTPSDGPMWITGTYEDPTGALPIEVRTGEATTIAQRFDLAPAEAEAIVRGEQGSVSWVEVEPVLDLVSQEIGQEIQRTLDYFGTTAEHERIQRIYLSGGCALIPGLQEFLAGQWGIEVIRANPFKRVDVGTGTDASMVEKLAPLASVATGLAMRYPDDRK